MFKCEKCKAYESEIAFLREQVKLLSEKVVALADTKAYGAIQMGRKPYVADEYFGSNDEVVEFNEFGEKVVS